MCEAPTRPDDFTAAHGELFSRLLAANERRIYAFIHALVHDRGASDDILQDVSAVLWKKFDKFEIGTDFGAWAMSVARLTIYEWRRRQKHLPLQLDDEQLRLLADEAVAVSCEFEERRAALQNCVQKLPRPDQDLLIARYHHGEPVISVAERVNRSRIAIYKRLNKLHAMLLECVHRRLAARGIGHG